MVGRLITLFILGLLTTVFLPAWGWSAEKAEESFDTIEALVLVLKEKGVMSEAEAAKFMRLHRKAQAAEERGTVVRLVPSEKEKLKAEVVQEVKSEVKEDVKARVKEELKAEVKEEMARDREGILDKAKEAIPDWVKRIQWGGDIRLRYQGEFYDKNNALLLKPDKPTELMNTQHDRHRFRVRARLEAKVDVTPGVEVGARISTGNETDPISTNETLGDYYNKDGIVLDRAYLKWDPAPWFTAWGGRFRSPWFSTDLVWDEDLNFEGLALRLSPQISQALKGFLTLGAFPLQEVEFSQQDKWLFGGQAGVRWEPSKNFRAVVAGGYYEFVNTVGVLNNPLRPGEKDYTAPLFQQKGNTLFDIDPGVGIKTALASAFREMNVTGELDIGVFDPIRIVLYGDYVRNLGYDRNDVARRTGVSLVGSETDGYLAGLRVGHRKVRDYLAWQVHAYYKYLEADAVIDAFTDSDFHMGGTNAKGWVLGGELGLARNVWLRARWMTADQISGPQFGVDLFQLDLNAAF
jgi:hypothetical protein